MGGAVQKAARAWLGVMCLAALGGCGDGLGECDDTMLGGNPIEGMVVPYTGQGIVAARCAGSKCHSEDAMGDERFGAPHGLNFDVVVGSVAEDAKLRRSVGTVVDWAEDMWSEIDSGTMPPEMPAGTGALSSADKEAVRNWLACGAPAIGPDPTAPSATWESIWSSLAPSCVNCHNATGSMLYQGALLGELGDPCGSYDNIVGHVSDTMECSGQTLVVPNNPGASQLLLKLKADPAACGSPMPLGSPTGLVGSTNENVIGLIETWIMNGAQKPPSCP
jgi:hypothetical protein